MSTKTQTRGGTNTTGREGKKATTPKPGNGRSKSGPVVAVREGGQTLAKGDGLPDKRFSVKQAEQATSAAVSALHAAQAAGEKAGVKVARAAYAMVRSGAFGTGEGQMTREAWGEMVGVHSKSRVTGLSLIGRAVVVYGIDPHAEGWEHFTTAATSGGVAETIRTAKNAEQIHAALVSWREEREAKKAAQSGEPAKEIEGKADETPEKEEPKGKPRNGEPVVPASSRARLDLAAQCLAGVREKDLTGKGGAALRETLDAIAAHVTRLQQADEKAKTA